MGPTPEQLAKSMRVHEEADRRVAEHYKEKYAKAGTCWACGDKIMEKAVFHDNECLHCERDFSQ